MSDAHKFIVDRLKEMNFNNDELDGYLKKMFKKDPEGYKEIATEVRKFAHDAMTFKI